MKHVTAQIDSELCRPFDLVLIIIDFLFDFKLACDTVGSRESTAIRLFSIFVKHLVSKTRHEAGIIAHEEDENNVC